MLKKWHFKNFLGSLFSLSFSNSRYKFITCKIQKKRKKIPVKQLLHYKLRNFPCWFHLITRKTTKSRPQNVDNFVTSSFNHAPRLKHCKSSPVISMLESLWVAKTSLLQKWEPDKLPIDSHFHKSKGPFHQTIPIGIREGQGNLSLFFLRQRHKSFTKHIWKYIL